MNKFIQFHMLLIALVLNGTAYAQSYLPSCQDAYNSQWSDCFGSLTTSNGDKYAGEFKNGRYNGQGTYTFADGRVGLGEWVGNKPSGRFIQYFSDKSIESSGIFEDGNLVKSQYIDPNNFTRIILVEQDNREQVQRDALTAQRRREQAQRDAIAEQIRRDKERSDAVVEKDRREKRLKVLCPLYWLARQTCAGASYYESCMSIRSSSRYSRRDDLECQAR